MKATAGASLAEGSRLHMFPVEDLIADAQTRAIPRYTPRDLVLTASDSPLLTC